MSEKEIQRNEGPETAGHVLLLLGYRLDPENGLIDEHDNPVYCSASGCESQAWELVGEGDWRLALCCVCADIWYMGFAAGKEAKKE